MDYALLNKQLAALLAGEANWLANLANTSALLFAELADINWVGFYLYRDGELVLGPFQGKPACVRIAIGQGVCGTTAEKRTATIVADVAKFPGHITCDPASRSELVIPLIKNGTLLGVLDVDSPILDRFDEEDCQGLSRIVETLLAGCDFSQSALGNG
ncbi:MAG TPA: GAF domain-containing protein [Firmicutes bacterium]|nr:GAF domain-containing protein [Bacillota bacterium]